jgi:hypothetical protein
MSETSLPFGQSRGRPDEGAIVESFSGEKIWIIDCPRKRSGKFPDKKSGGAMKNVIILSSICHADVSALWEN